MTISNNEPRIQIIADGTIGPFPFQFRIFEEEDLRVFDGAAQKALTTDYTIDFDFEDPEAESGSILFVSGNQPADQAILTMDRRVSSERAEDFQQSGPPVEGELNEGFDRVWAKIQENGEIFKRLVRLADTTAFTGDVVFPDGGVAEAGKVIGWASGGLSLENKDLVGSGMISLPLVVGEGGTGATTPSGAKENLGFIEEADAILAAQVFS